MNIAEFLLPGMGEAEKINEPVGMEKPAVGQSEAFDKQSVFNELFALVDGDGFDLCNRIKKSKELDPKIRQEMLYYIDEAKDIIVNFKREGPSQKLRNEAEGVLGILQQMAGEHLPAIKQDIVYYKAKILKKNLGPRLVVDNVGSPEKTEEAAAMNIPLHQKETSEEAAAAVPAVTAEVAPSIEAVEERTAVDVPSQGGEIVEEEIKENALDKKNIVDIKDEKKYQGENPLFNQQAKRFGDVRQASEVDMEKVEKAPSRKRGGGNNEEPPGGGDKEKLKEQLDAVYKELYGFLNEKRAAPKELYDSIRQIENDLRGAVKFRGEVSDLAEQLKEKYKKDERSEEEKIKKSKKEKKADKEESVGAKKELGENLSYTEEMIASRAAEIKQRREKGEKGFEWERIRELIRRQGLVPDTAVAGEFMKKWDRNTAISELRKEERKREKEGVEDNKTEGRSGKKGFLRIKTTGELGDVSLEEVDAEERKELEGYEKERELARLGAEITLSKITDYKELWAQTEQEGDEVFEQKTRELWKELAVHGLVGFDEDKKPVFTNGTDLDGQGCLWLMQLAGFDTSNVKYIKHGDYAEDRIYFDIGNQHGVVLQDGGRKVFIDHHTNESGKESSATKFTYELLRAIDLLKDDKHLSDVVDFITRIDNKTYPLNKDTFKDSWRTIYGLHHYLDFPKIVELLKAGLKPDKVLSEEDLKKFDLNEASQQQKETVRVSLAKMRGMEKRGLIVPSERFGKIVVDIEKKIGAGVDAAWAFGCQTYIIWSPESGSFFITSTERLDKEKIGQGGPVRGYMWIKSRVEKEPLAIKLADILNALTDGKLEPTGKLAEFLVKEEQRAIKEKKAELPPEKREIFKKFGQEFYGALKDGADWEGYDEAKKFMTLEIQTGVFLTKQIKRLNLVGEDKITEVVESLVKEISK